MLRILFGSLLLSGAMAVSTAAQNAPGVTDSEIRMGQTMPYTGPGRLGLDARAKAEVAYMKMINDQGGMNGRKINLISPTTATPAAHGEETRRLVKQDGVALIFGSLGTATNTAIARYLNERKIPQLFLGSAPTSGATTRRPRGRSGGCARFRTGSAHLRAVHLGKGS